LKGQEQEKDIVILCTHTVIQPKKEKKKSNKGKLLIRTKREKKNSEPRAVVVCGKEKKNKQRKNQQKGKKKRTLAYQIDKRTCCKSYSALLDKVAQATIANKKFEK
jgi:co-chaperonin GroES (HSP10)